MIRVMCLGTIGFLLMACFLACDDDGGGVGSKGPVTVEIGFGDTIMVPGFPVALTLTTVNDGRCPSNGFCDWGGMADIFVQATIDQQAVSLWLPMQGATVTANPSDWMPIDTLGYHFVLTQLAPYPPVAADSLYRATISLSSPEQTKTTDGEIAIGSQTPGQIFRFDFGLDSMSIEDNRLNVSIAHGGGCLPHYYWAFMIVDSGDVGNPPQANLYLRHFHFGDLCRALIHRRLRFDLGKVIDEFNTRCQCETPIRINMHGDTITNQLLTAMYYPPDWFPSPMLPMALDNYWVYLDSTWDTDHFVVSIDSIAVIDSFEDDLGEWWVLSNRLLSLGDTIMVRGDSVFDRQYGFSGQIPLAALQYIPAIDTPFIYSVLFGGDVAIPRLVSRLDTAVSIAEQSWVGAYEYKTSLPNQGGSEILVPGIGFVYWDNYITIGPLFDPGRKTRLLRYHLQE